MQDAAGIGCTQQHSNKLQESCSPSLSPLPVWIPCSWRGVLRRVLVRGALRPCLLYARSLNNRGSYPSRLIIIGGVSFK